MASTDDPQALRERVETLEAELEELTSDEVTDEGGRSWTPADLMNIGLTRRQSLVAFSAIASGATFLGGVKTGMSTAAAETSGSVGQVGTTNQRVDVFSDLIDSNEVSTERPVTTILDGDDAQGKIESADPYTWFIIEPGTEFDIDPPLSPPKGSFLDGGTSAFSVSGSSAPVTFVKSGNGDHVEVPNQFRARGIAFDGNSSTYSGDGLVDKEWNVSNCNLDHCHILHQAGDGRVHNAHGFARYRMLRIEENGGFAVRNMTTDYDGLRRSKLDLRLNNNSSGAIKIESSDRHNEYTLRDGGNGGACFHVDSAGESAARFHRIYGSIEGNDGPALYIESGELRSWTFDTMQISGNASDEGFVESGPAASVVHIDDASNDIEINGVGGAWRSGSSDAIITNESNENLDMSVYGVETSGGDTVYGRVFMTIPDGLFWSAEIDGGYGYMIHTHVPGEGYIENLEGGERWFFGLHGSPPTSNPEEGSVHVNTGFNTDDGTPGWQYYTGSDWIDI